MKIAYFDCASGISGDMALGALVDAGVLLEEMQKAVASLGIGNFELKSHRVNRAGIQGTKVDVLAHGKEPRLPLTEVEKKIQQSALDPTAKKRAIAALDRFSEAEAKTHGKAKKNITLLDVGGLDTLVDVVGTAVGLSLLGIEEVILSPVNVGSGSATHPAHPPQRSEGSPTEVKEPSPTEEQSVERRAGRLSVPAPATARILSGVPIYSAGPAMELTTPTGAAMVATLASKFGPVPPMQVDRVAFGAGSKNPPGFANLLRLMIGRLIGKEEGVPPIGPEFRGARPEREARAEAATAVKEGRHRRETIDTQRAEPDRVSRPAESHRPEPPVGEDEEVVVIETSIDDMNPQLFDYVMEKSFAAGAIDVFMTPIIMKKGRPGILLTVLAEPKDADAVADLLFAETTTIGLRVQKMSRKRLTRRVTTVKTKYGTVRVKVSGKAGADLQATPEYADLKAIAQQSGVPLKKVTDEVMKSFRKEGRSG